MDEAMKPDAMRIYPEYEDGNICSHDHTHKGSVERGFAIWTASHQGTQRGLDVYGRLLPPAERAAVGMVQHPPTTMKTAG